MLDHDNLTKGIFCAVEKINKSCLRGQQFVLYSELDGLDGIIEKETQIKNEAHLKVPKVFSMRRRWTHQDTKQGYFSEHYWVVDSR